MKPESGDFLNDSRKLYSAMRVSKLGNLAKLTERMAYGGMSDANGGMRAGGMLP